MTQRSYERNGSSGNSQISQTFRGRKVVENPKSLASLPTLVVKIKHALVVELRLVVRRKDSSCGVAAC